MFSLVINPDKSVVYTEMVNGTQITHVILSDVVESIMSAAPTGATRWVDLDAAFDAYIATLKV